MDLLEFHCKSFELAELPIWSIHLTALYDFIFANPLTLSKFELKSTDCINTLILQTESISHPMYQKYFAKLKIRIIKVCKFCKL